MGPSVGEGAGRWEGEALETGCTCISSHGEPPAGPPGAPGIAPVAGGAGRGGGGVARRGRGTHGRRRRAQPRGAKVRYHRGHVPLADIRERPQVDDRRRDHHRRVVCPTTSSQPSPDSVRLRPEQPSEATELLIVSPLAPYAGAQSRATGRDASSIGWRNLDWLL